MKWKKPSGLIIETTDGKATTEYMKSLGYEYVQEREEKPERKKPGPKPK